jgi:hypothetical protein
MNARLTIAAVGTATALVAGGVVLALPASAGSASHTLRFTAVKQSQAHLSKQTSVASDHDMAGGKVIGYDVVTFAGRGTGDVAVGLNGGLLYGSLTFSKSGALTGKVTGGTGPYAGIAGTISGQTISNNKTKVVVSYHG